MRKLMFTLAIAAGMVSAMAQATTWYAGSRYQGTVMVQGLAWKCSGGSCVLTGPYGAGLNMDVCRELSRKVGPLDYYYNDAGMTWSQEENKSLLAQCNKR